MLNPKDAIFVTLAGSHAHGTSGPESDIDLRGVCVGRLPVRVSLYQKFEQFEGTPEGPLWDRIQPALDAHETARHSLSGKVEAVIYDVAKFLELCAAANPNALEILFADLQDWLYRTKPWIQIYKERHRFLTKKLEATYLGYGLAQFKKIRLHRGWLLNPPKKPPTRAEFGLPEVSTLSLEDRCRIDSAVSNRIRRYRIDDLELPKATRIQLEERMQRFMTDVLECSEETLEAAVRQVATAALKLPAGVVQAFEAERRFRAAQKHWASYLAWMQRRNPARAELERRYGYDTKHAAHLLRLLETGLEVIQTGELRVRRENAKELIAVKEGALTFEALTERATELQLEMRRAMQRCTLPDDVDHAFVDELALQLILGTT